MKKANLKKKLQLQRETVRGLTDGELQRVVGGAKQEGARDIPTSHVDCTVPPCR